MFQFLCVYTQLPRKWYIVNSGDPSRNRAPSGQHAPSFSVCALGGVFAKVSCSLRCVARCLPGSVFKASPPPAGIRYWRSHSLPGLKSAAPPNPNSFERTRYNSASRALWATAQLFLNNKPQASSTNRRWSVTVAPAKGCRHRWMTSSLATNRLWTKRSSLASLAKSLARCSKWLAKGKFQRIRLAREHAIAGSSVSARWLRPSQKQ